MPKVNKRRTLVEPPYRHTAPLNTQARKVSFEDGADLRQSPRLGPQNSSMSSSSLIPRITACRNIRSKSGMLMRRPTPSVALCDLATPNSPKATQIPMSPRQQSRLSPLSLSDSEDSGSPWGQFVDVVPTVTPETDTRSFLGESGHHNSSLVHSSKSNEPYLMPKRYPIKHKHYNLSGFLLSIPAEIPDTDEVERSLRHMHV